MLKEKSDPSAPIVLIFDGHNSHEAKKIRPLAKARGRHLFFLPPHSTHNLPPLDVSIFGPLQRVWQERCENILEETGEEMQRADITSGAGMVAYEEPKTRREQAQREKETLDTTLKAKEEEQEQK